jgi:hypothetical protein
MSVSFKPRIDILPKPQQEIWPELAAASQLDFVLYGGTAIALQLGHRVSIDFDFFGQAPLDKDKIRASFPFMRGAQVIQDSANTLVVNAKAPSGPVKVSFFGGIANGRLNEPIQTEDQVLRVASLEDLLATKLKSILQRAEAKDYRDISAMLRAGTSLPRALGAFRKMYGQDPSHPLRAMGYFSDGDLPSLPAGDQDLLRAARDRVSDIPDVSLTY